MNLSAISLRSSIIIMGLFTLGYILYLAQGIFVPLTFAWIFSMLLNPAVNYLIKWKINRIVAISLVIVVFVGLIMLIVFFIMSQLGMLSDSWPALKKSMAQCLGQFLQWVSRTFHVSHAKVMSWIEKEKAREMEGASGTISSTLGTLSDWMVNLCLLPIYTFLFLYYKPLLLNFLAQLFPKTHHATVLDILHQVIKLVQSYIAGLMIEMAIVAVMNAVALLMIGVPYAILMGVIGAILNLIPYIGGIVAIALPIVLSLLTGDPAAAVMVVLAYTFIQIIDNNFLVPKIVASKVQVNALVSIVVVLIGGAIWGVAGMFLAIPLASILKVICDKIPELKPMGFLIGDSMPEAGKSIFKIVRRRKVVAEGS